MNNKPTPKQNEFAAAHGGVALTTLAIDRMSRTINKAFETFDGIADYNVVYFPSTGIGVLYLNLEFGRERVKVSYSTASEAVGVELLSGGLWTYRGYYSRQNVVDLMSKLQSYGVDTLLALEIADRVTKVL